MCEQRLPPSVLRKASLRGKEYAWPLAVVEEVVTAAVACGLANGGGVAQFRIPDAVCDLYWLSVESEKRLHDEPWGRYVTRSADEVLARFSDLRSRTDFIKEGISFPCLHQLHRQGVDLDQYLCFVLYFNPEPTEFSLSVKSSVTDH